MADLKAIQVDTLILADAITQSTAWFPSKISGLKYGGSDAVGMALQAAESARLRCIVGLVLPSSWFHYGAMNGSFMEELALRQNAVVQELQGCLSFFVKQEAQLLRMMLMRRHLEPFHQ